MENEIPKATNQQLIQFIPDAAVLTDSSFTITAWNKAAVALFNYRQHEVLGFDISFLIPASNGTNNQALSLKNISFSQDTITHLNKAGQTLFLQVSRHAIAPETNSGYLFIYKPIDPDKESAESSETTSNDLSQKPVVIAQKSEEKYRWLIEQSGDAIIIFNQAFFCLDANAGACTLTGYDRQELMRINLRDLIQSDTLNQSLPGPTELVSKEKILWEGKMWAKDGATYYAEFTFQRMYEDRVFSFVRDITKRKKTELALRQTTAQLRQLSDHLLNVRELERTNIAREIHDELGQQLTILKMNISWLHQRLQKYEDVTVLQKTSDTLNMLNDTIKTVRRIATELRPSMLDDLGLIEAIEWQSKEFANRSGINITFEPFVSHLPVSNGLATSLFRIYQEALTNIGRHAHAKNVYSKLQVANDQLVLTIKDDGIGFEMQTLGTKKTLGILGMKERTLMMGGRFEITSKSGEGTTIVITTTLPLENTAETRTDI